MDAEQDDYTLTKELTTVLGADAETVQRDIREFRSWMLAKGKNPDRKKGLAGSTADNYCDRLDQIVRLMIYLMGPESKTRVTRDQADLIVKWLDEDEIQQKSGTPYSETAKRKFTNALEKYFQWREDRDEDEEVWEPSISFSASEYESADKLNFEERWRIREEAVNYGSLPSYASASPDERDEIAGLIAQRLGKPKEEVTRKDWERADQSTEIGSLVAVGLETGITPVEVQEARVHWYKKDRQVLEIPREYASKNRPTSKLPVTDETAELMSKWIQERRHYEKYDGTDRLWLNQKGNPFDSANLCDLVRRLCEKAGINHENRKIVWYSLRHNVGQSIEEIEDVSEASDQLRHDSIETTKRFYAESAIESRRETLERVNEAARRTVEDPMFNPYRDETETETQGRARYPDENTRSGTTGNAGANKVHIDTNIRDTPKARNRLAKEILDGGDS